MKTQRPSDTVDKRPSSDGSSLADDADGAEDVGQENGDAEIVEASSVRTVRTLPKRKAAQPAQPEAKVAVTAEPPPTEKPAKSKTPASVAAPPQPETPAPKPSVAQKAWRAVVTYENIFWLTIFVVAIVSRFYDVGTKALHHDESLHAVYSRNLYSGIGYQHDPMMHGPLQFHYIGAMFWLFGTDDAVSRFASILCGLFVVMSPFFLRRQMGKVPALVCGFLLLISPGVLYFSRMAREDAIFSGMEMIMIVGLWRFLSERKPADFFLFAAGLSLMFTIKESAYLTVAVLGVFFLLLFALQAGWAIVGATAGYIASLGVLYLLDKGKTFGKLPDIPQTNPDYNTIFIFAQNILTHPIVMLGVLFTLIYVGALTGLFIMKRNQLVGRKEKPVRVTTPTSVPVKAANSGLPARRVSASSIKVRENTSAPLSAGSDGAATVALATSSDNGRETVTEVAEESSDGLETEAATPSTGSKDQPRKRSSLWNPLAIQPKPNSLFAHYEEGSMPYILGCLFARPAVLLIGFLVAATIFVVFYSVFFTDVPRGILSGLFASLGYWMGQHDVRRGDQPWFYYFLLVPLYQPIAVFFSICATIFFSWRGIRWLRERLQLRRYSEEPGLGAFNTDRVIPFAKWNAFMPLFLIWWLFGVTFIYSWAGEKMPWLMAHITRPAIFLASLFLGALFLSLMRMRRERMEAAGLLDGEPRTAPSFQRSGRSMAGAGARFSLGSLFNLSGLRAPKRELAYAYPPGSARFSSPRGGSNVPPPPAPRKQPAYAGASASKGLRSSVAVERNQEPPWVTWNRADSVFPFAFYITLFTLLGVAWGLALAQKTYSSDYASWGWTWSYPVVMIVLTIAYAIWLGVGRALRYLGVGIFSVMLLYELHAAFILSYRNPDVSTEMAVYVQSSPDVTRVMEELEDFSYYTTGAKDVKIVYDSEVSWPMEWYLGDYKNKKFIGGSPPTEGDYDAPVMFLGYNRLDDPALKARYIPQRYALRWWFPEEWYKNSFLGDQLQKDASGATINDAAGQPLPAPPLAQLGSFIGASVSAFTTPSNMAELWKYLMYRETPKPLGSTDFVLFVRKDYAQLWHNLQNNPLPSTDVPIQPERTDGPMPRLEVRP